MERYSIQIYYDNTKISQVSSQKFLGEWFNENLSSAVHISKLASELSKIVGLLFRISKFLPVWLKVSMYNALFFFQNCHIVILYGVRLRLQTTINYYCYKKQPCVLLRVITVHHKIYVHNLYLLNIAYYKLTKCSIYGCCNTFIETVCTLLLTGL